MGTHQMQPSNRLLTGTLAKSAVHGTPLRRDQPKFPNDEVVAHRLKQNRWHTKQFGDVFNARYVMALCGCPFIPIDENTGSADEGRA